MKICVSIGDTNGIGLETLFRAAEKLRVQSRLPDISICTSISTACDYAQKLGYSTIVDRNKLYVGSVQYTIIDCATTSQVEFGKQSTTAAQLAVESLDMAIRMTLEKQFDALVTLPVSKQTLHSVGWNYPGQTEMIAEYCKIDKPLMILCNQRSRVGLVTIHIPLSDVPQSITSENVLSTIILMHNSLKADFGIHNPTIAVLGLNPHAGESGDIGIEEITSINPAIQEAQKRGICCDGAFAADGFFAHGQYLEYDGIVAQYHDQGLIPIKLLSSSGGVNITAGLPIIRTSPDHGTAYHLAGKGVVNSDSTLEALVLAQSVVTNRVKILT